jgi:hypothetical protein
VFERLYEGYLGARRGGGWYLPALWGAADRKHSSGESVYRGRLFEKLESLPGMAGWNLKPCASDSRAGSGFQDAVIRWPFEKTVFFNRKSHMYRINQKFYQIVGDIQERTVSIPQNSVGFIRNFASCD